MLKPILSTPPTGIQLEVLSRDKFSEFVQKRYRGMGNRTFERHMRRLARMQRMRPLLRYKGKPYYSPLQIVSFDNGLYWDDSQPAEFDRLLTLVHEVQDNYLPEVRSNGRSATWIDHRGFFVRTNSIPVSVIRNVRSQRIKSGRLDLPNLLKQHGLTAECLCRWRRQLALRNRGLNPLHEWHELVERIAYEKRQQLRYEALLAQDYRDLGVLIVLLLRDLSVLKPYEGLHDAFPQDPETGLPDWLLEKYGQEHLDNPFHQLELLTNEYDLNPKPRGIIFTEGDEWKALEILFTARNFDPRILGIEFRSIHSIGNFNFHHWKGFLEYMQEKQVLVFFAIDSERKDIEHQIRKFTTVPRLTHVDGLKAVLLRDRIRVWDTSFEESNFTDQEIADAFTALGQSLTADEVAKERSNANRKKGLAEALMKEGLSKPALDMLLVRQLVASAETRNELRPVEEFVDEAGETISLNHQPTDNELIAINRQNGFLG